MATAAISSSAETRLTDLLIRLDGLLSGHGLAGKPALDDED